MIYIQFLIGFALYCIMAGASYNNEFKMHKMYFPVAVITAVIANLLWFNVAKSEHNQHSLMIKGLVWDVMITTTYLIIPIMFFSVKLTILQLIGLGLIFSGLLLTKLA